VIPREHAWSILTEFTKSDSLRKHARAVEASMRAYAAKHGEDPDTWTSTTRCTRAPRTTP